MAQFSQAAQLALQLGFSMPGSDVAAPSLCVQDPVMFPFTISAGALSVGNAPTDVTNSEQSPANVGSDGAYKSRGTTKPMVGGVFGVTVLITDGDADDVAKVLRSFETVIKANGRYRVAPFAEAVRIAPGRAPATTATSTTLNPATGCPSAPGKPMYPFGGFPIPWTGDRDDSIGYRCNYAGGTTSGDVKGQIIVWGFLAPGSNQDVQSGTIPGTDCEDPRTFPALQKLVQTAAAWRRQRF